MALAILELIIFICSFHVKCLSIYSPKNFALFLFVLANLIHNFIVYFNAIICLAVGVSWDKNVKHVFLTFKYNVIAHNQSCICLIIDLHF